MLPVRFEVFTAVTVKKTVLWNVTPCSSCKDRRFEGKHVGSSDSQLLVTATLFLAN
jgi:hypothetical protein